jgi:hypothetical protein
VLQEALNNDVLSVDFFSMARPPQTPPGRNALEEAAQQLGVPPWGKVLIGGLALAAVAIAGALIHAEIRLASIGTTVDALPSVIDSKLDANDSKIDAKLSSLRADMIQQFLQKAKQFTESRNYDDASAALRAAAILTSIAKDNREPAEAGFFREAVFNLNSVQPFAQPPSLLAAPVHKASIQLASYRSALETLPPLPKHYTEKDLAHALGVNTILFQIGPNREFDMLYPMPAPNPPQHIQDLGFADGSQGLDNVIWDHVVFINMHIRYDDVGPVTLRDVKFVNCSFSFASTPRAVDLANSIATRERVIAVAGPFRIEKRDVPVPLAPKH